MTRISGQLDPEGAAVLRAALDPLSVPHPCVENGGRDTRPADRRRAEALVFCQHPDSVAINVLSAVGRWAGRGITAG